MFHLKPDPVLEDDIEQMELLLWKWRQRYSVRYDEAAQLSGDKPPEIYKDWFDEFDDWIVFEEENYEKHSLFSSLVLIPLVLVAIRLGAS